MRFGPSRSRPFSDEVTRKIRLSLTLECLEDRVAPAVITVTSTGNVSGVDGHVTLDEAIASINAGANINGDVVAVGPYGTNDTIDFNIPGSGVRTIANDQLPTITKPLTIDGYSQPGASPNTLVNGDNAVLLIQLQSTDLGGNGLNIAAGGCTVRGLVINGFDSGIRLFDKDGNRIVGNFIGTNPAGNGAPGNLFSGIDIDSSSNNTIGGTSPADRNVLSGNSDDGINVSFSSGNVIQGNFIGVNAAGTGPVAIRPSGYGSGQFAGNLVYGIQLAQATANTIGGTAAGAGNVIGFNLDGIEFDHGSQNNVVQGNLVGVGADGMSPTGNILHGISFASYPFDALAGNQNNVVGGTVPGAGNTVEFNGQAGVAVFGTSAQTNTGNAILGNSIFSNGRNDPNFFTGIDLSIRFPYPQDDGVTPNHTGTATGPNNLQNFPVLTSATLTSGPPGFLGDTLTITGSLDSTPSTTFRIEFFLTDSAGGIPEGHRFLFARNVSTDASGHASFSFTEAFEAEPIGLLGNSITATATDPGNNTSEFSAAAPVLGNPVPSIASLSTTSADEGSGPIELTVTGSGFVSSSQVEVNGTAVPVTFISGSKLQATIPATLLAQEGNLTIAVVNPPPSGGTSNSETLTVTDALLAPPEPTSLSAVVLGNTQVVYAVSAKHGLLMHSGSADWVQLGGDGSILSIAAVPSSWDTTALAITTDHALFRFDASVSAWHMIGGRGTIAALSAGYYLGPTAFVLTTAGDFTEWSETGGWLASPIGARGTIRQFSALQDGAVVVVTNDNSVYEYDNIHGWFPLSGSGFAAAVSAVLGNTGEVVYALRLERSLAQRDPSTGWVTLEPAGSVSELSAGNDAPFSQADVFALLTDGSLVEDFRGGRSVLAPLPGTIDSIDAAGENTVFMVLTDGSVFGHDNSGFFRLGAPGFAATG